MGMFASLMIALAMTGVGVAHWSDTVQIEGRVQMGELIVGILDGSLDWDESTNDVPEDDFIPPKPWVANADIVLSDWQTSVHHDPPQTVAHKMTINITNAYPQWDLEIYFDLKNAGTIPATYTQLLDLSAYDETDQEDLVWREDYWGYNGAWIWEGALCNPDGTEIMNVYVEAEVPEDGQLEPCTEYPVYIWLDFKQTAEECHTYTFSAEFEFVQWNKAY